MRYWHQRERFVSALVRPLVWLFIFAAGFRSVLGVSIIPPYDTYVLYEVYIAPGLIAMIALFSGMQSSLSMVYDREMGNMRTLLVSPFPRWFLLTSKLAAGTAVSLAQIYAFLFVAYFWEIEPPSPWGYLTVLPALVLSGLMLGALGMLLSSLIKQLENFAGVMNFVIFPMFFASSALYPLWRVKEGSPWLATLCELNPFTHAVELIRFALYERINFLSLGGGARDDNRLSRRGNCRLRSLAWDAPTARGTIGSRNLFLLTVGTELREIGNKIVPVFFFRQPGENHFRAGDLGFRIGEILLERRLVPGDSGLFVRIGIIIIRSGACLAPNQAVQFRSDEVLRAFADLMADLALLREDCFARGGIARQCSCGGASPSGRGDKADIFTLHIRFPSL